MKYILASQSPRRKELLGKCNLKFEIEPAVGEERITGSDPEQVVRALAKAKAQEIAQKHTGEDVLVIGADTVVAIDDQILGKPKDRAQLLEMIGMLQGRTHKVYTGVAFVHVISGRQTDFSEETQVAFYPMSQEEILEYEAIGDGYDKAGGYGIQSAASIYIRGICGDYNNVVGLPVARLYHELQKFL